METSQKLEAIQNLNKEHDLLLKTKEDLSKAHNEIKDLQHKLKETEEKLLSKVKIQIPYRLNFFIYLDVFLNTMGGSARWWDRG